MTNEPSSHWQPDRTGRKGDWITTQSGLTFWPIDPRPSEVTREDIAHALSLKCRWTGHCDRFYSVAEHSVRVAKAVRYLAAWTNPELSAEGLDQVELIGLLHDGHEAYMADLARPLKPFVSGWKDLEAGIDEAIFGHFSITPTDEEHQLVKQADNELLKAEARVLFTKHRAGGLDLGPVADWCQEAQAWLEEVEGLPPNYGWSWPTSKAAFLKSLETLTQGI
jgi:uncharacterized protein